MLRILPLHAHGFVVRTGPQKGVHPHTYIIPLHSRVKKEPFILDHKGLNITVVLFIRRARNMVSWSFVTVPFGEEPTYEMIEGLGPGQPPFLTLKNAAPDGSTSCRRIKVEWSFQKKFGAPILFLDFLTQEGVWSIDRAFATNIPGVPGSGDGP
jgi:hypothetical protein